MEFPAAVRAELESMLDGADIKELAANAERVSKRYRDNTCGASQAALNSAGRNGKGKGKGHDPFGASARGRGEVLAYAAARMPATFGAAARAILLSAEPFKGEIHSVLDVGAGTGAAALAAWELLGGAEITCMERDRDMAAVGERLLKAEAVNARWIRGDLSKEVPFSADLVICAYCLSELKPSERAAAVSRLWDAAGKLLIIVDTGTPAGFELIKTMRGRLAELGGNIVAPCPHARECPLEAGDWCHFTARTARSCLQKRLKNGEAPYEDEKFCFLAVSREKYPLVSARVLRHPLIESGKITLRLCESGGISDRVITRKSPLFKAARKAACGDAFDKTADKAYSRPVIQAVYPKER